jgi:hypothetical protein
MHSVSGHGYSSPRVSVAAVFPLTPGTLSIYCQVIKLVLEKQTGSLEGFHQQNMIPPPVKVSSFRIQSFVWVYTVL